MAPGLKGAEHRARRRMSQGGRRISPLEVDRLGLIRTLREDSLHLGLKVIHLHYTTGVLSDDLNLHDELPNILDLDKPVPTNVDFKKKRHLIAPNSLGISMERAQASREAARKVIDFNLEDIRRLAEDR